MKRGLVFSLVILFGIAAASASVTARLEPDSVAVGDTLELQLSSDEGAIVTGELPKLSGGAWRTDAISRGSSQTVFGTRRTQLHTLTIPVAATRAGKLVIPPLKLTVAGRSVATPELSAEITSAAERVLGVDASGRKLTARDAIIARIAVIGGRREFYVGEEVPLSLDLLVRREIEFQPNQYPVLDISDAVIRDHSRTNPDNNRFEVPPRRFETVTEGGAAYTKLSFRTAFRSLKAGSVSPRAEIHILVAEQAKKDRRGAGSDHELISSFLGAHRRYRPFAVAYESGAPIHFRAKPEVPSGDVDTGLVGDWRIEFPTEIPDKTAVGELLTLRMRLTGDGTAENFSAPQPELPGFRVYPPEVKRQDGVITVSYALIPLHAGEARIRFRPAVFDVHSGQYQAAEFDKTIAVAPAARPLPALSAGSAAPDASAVQFPGEPAKPRENIFYLKAAPATSFTLPASLAVAGFLLGPAAWLAVELLARRRAGRRGDGRAIRRERAGRALRPLLRRLKQAATREEFDSLVCAEVVALLADRFDLPPGISATELADRPECDAELAAILRQSGSSAYAPGASGVPLAQVRPKLTGILKRIVAFALLLWGLTLSASDWQQAVHAYDAGDFAGSYAKFEKTEANSAREYNLGCAAFMQGNYPLAAFRFERARLLSPRDSETIGNLNLARRKLQLPEIGSAETPRELIRMLRDSATPDEYLALAIGCWLICFALLIFRRRIERHAFRIGLGGFGLLTLLMLAAFVSLRGDSCRAARGCALETLELYSLPASSAKAVGKIPAGADLDVLEERNGHLLVRTQAAEGWTRKSAVGRFFSSPF